MSARKKALDLSALQSVGVESTEVECGDGVLLVQCPSAFAIASVTESGVDIADEDAIKTQWPKVYPIILADVLVDDEGQRLVSTPEEARDLMRHISMDVASDVVKAAFDLLSADEADIMGKSPEAPTSELRSA